MSVAAWEPELPPVEIQSGTNNARTTTRLIASSKCDNAVNVNNSAINRQASQMARLRQIVTKFAVR